MRSMMEDRLLLWTFKRGSPDALRRVYEKYKNDLLKLAVALVTDVNTAEDVVQDVFVCFAQSAARIGITGDLRKYLVTCVANRIRNRRRDQQRHEAIGLDGAESLVCGFRRPEQWAILNEQLRLLSGALAQLPYEQREVVSLHTQGDLTFREIAAIQKAPINTVQGRYRYGMSKLRSLLNGELDNETGG
ncbi:MAG: sigma-70 family RNA polymerase sigma factor [Planctomycetes bacterium]|jgi:RNA polymerase sigma-70 factor (ECF subfamily)|nr:sigma-70 family RNA polymerase sigma factor [Planctomycetota bacterium]